MNTSHSNIEDLDKQLLDIVDYLEDLNFYEHGGERGDETQMEFVEKLKTIIKAEKRNLLNKLLEELPPKFTEDHRFPGNGTISDSQRDYNKALTDVTEVIYNALKGLSEPKVVINKYEGHK